MLLTPPQTVAPPSSKAGFAALMELYENNYIYLRRLVPQLDGERDHLVSQVDHAPALYLQVTERFPYTTSVFLTHRFDACSSKESLPDLQVRIYHDARVAEVIPPLDNQAQPPSLAWRWVANRFLSRWLKYCLGEGHGFAMDDAEAAVIYRPEAKRWAV